MSEKAEPRRALGRGLDALLPVSADKAPAGFGERSVFTCPIERVVPMKGQPRQHFDERALEELAQSIREVGLLEPLVVRKLPPVTGAPPAMGDRYELIAGERRWRAAQRAGLKDVLVVVKDVSPVAAFELAMIENVQREDLNPIELAEAFHRLIKEHGYTQERLAERIGKDRTTIANSLRLLRLPPTVRERVMKGELTEGHARALLQVGDDAELQKLADKVVRGRLSVRQTEQLARQTRGAGAEPTPDKPAQKSASVRDLERRLSLALGTRCEVRDQGGKGEIAVHYASLDALDAVLDKILK
ncbi:MAG: ParB/RepB/Spo0J family partition protein [Deltaproteobacteria bacterium]|nr:ParB/RepB/Spo0J family partition protein [Deltaproteobacteria bacterium]